VENGPALTYLGLKTVRPSLQINDLLLLMHSIGPPTQGHVYQTLLQAERVAELAGKSVVNNTQMINIALGIECQQYVDLHI
jgi:hypothetical protein